MGEEKPGEKDVERDEKPKREEKLHAKSAEERRKNQEDVGNKSFSFINILSISFLLLLHGQCCLFLWLTKQGVGEIFVLLAILLGQTVFFVVNNCFSRKEWWLFIIIYKIILW